MNRGDLVWYVGPGKDQPRPGVILQVRELHLRILYGTSRDLTREGIDCVTILARSRLAPRYGITQDTFFGPRNIHLVLRSAVVREQGGAMLPDLFLKMCALLGET
jgi:hypothetical protein